MRLLVTTIRIVCDLLLQHVTHHEDECPEELGQYLPEPRPLSVALGERSVHLGAPVVLKETRVRPRGLAGRD